MLATKQSPLANNQQQAKINSLSDISKSTGFSGHSTEASSSSNFESRKISSNDNKVMVNEEVIRSENNPFDGIEGFRSENTTFYDVADSKKVIHEAENSSTTNNKEGILNSQVAYINAMSKRQLEVKIDAYNGFKFWRNGDYYKKKEKLKIKPLIKNGVCTNKKNLKLFMSDPLYLATVQILEGFRMLFTAQHSVEAGNGKIVKQQKEALKSYIYLFGTNYPVFVGANKSKNEKILNMPKNTNFYTNPDENNQLESKGKYATVGAFKTVAQVEAWVDWLRTEQGVTGTIYKIDLKSTLLDTGFGPDSKSIKLEKEVIDKYNEQCVDVNDKIILIQIGQSTGYKDNTVNKSLNNIAQALKNSPDGDQSKYLEFEDLKKVILNMSVSRWSSLITGDAFLKNRATKTGFLIWAMQEYGMPDKEGVLEKVLPAFGCESAKDRAMVVKVMRDYLSTAIVAIRNNNTTENIDLQNSSAYDENRGSFAIYKNIYQTQYALSYKKACFELITCGSAKFVDMANEPVNKDKVDKKTRKIKEKIFNIYDKAYKYKEEENITKEGKQLAKAIKLIKELVKIQCTVIPDSVLEARKHEFDFVENKLNPGGDAIFADLQQANQSKNGFMMAYFNKDKNKWQLKKINKTTNIGT